MVPDFSLTSDLSSSCFNNHLANANTEFKRNSAAIFDLKTQTRNVQISSTPPRPTSPPRVCFYDFNDVERAKQTTPTTTNNNNFINSNRNLNNVDKHRGIEIAPLKSKVNSNASNCKPKYSGANGCVAVSKKCVNTTQKPGALPDLIKSRAAVAPKVMTRTQQNGTNPVRKSSTDARELRNNGSKKPLTPSLTQEEMLRIIKQQDEQLRIISEQIQELLRIHKIKEKKIGDVTKKNDTSPKPDQKTVSTNTSIEWPNTSTPLRSRQGEFRTRNNRLTPSTPSRDLRDVRLTPIHESDSESQVQLETNELEVSESPERSLNPSESASNVCVRHCEVSPNFEADYYDRMLDEIEKRLSQSESCTSEDDGRRSSCSPTPPREHRACCCQLHPRRNERVDTRQHTTEQTLYIKRLATKYLTTHDNGDARKCQRLDCHHCRRDLSPQKRLQQCCPPVEPRRTNREYLKVYGLTKEVSIATKNYLERYGLTYKTPHQLHYHPHQHQTTPLKITRPNDNRKQNYSDNCRHAPGSNNRILDIEALKRQPKLT